MKIFTYGSNMNINRLKERVPSAIKICNASVEGYKFSFNKRSSVDGSARGNILQTNDVTVKVWGVVFEIAESDKSVLDLVEGLGKGYNEQQIDLFDDKGNVVRAQVYIADTRAINNEVLPFDWYKAFVVTGAEQNNLPADYIETLKNTTAKLDKNVQRNQKQQAILTGIKKP